jgi:hypothetical protein
MHRAAMTSLLALLALTACDRTSTETIEAPGTRALTHVEGPEVSLEELDVVEVVEQEVTALVALDVEPAETYEGPIQLVSMENNENLVLLAEWAGVSVEDVLDANPDLDPMATLHPGQAIALPIGQGELNRFESERNAWGQDRLDRYLDRHGGLAGVQEQRVRTGDTAWSLATDQADVPMWVFAAFNDGVDLNALQIGQVVRVPVLVDSVELALEEEATPSLSAQVIEEVDGVDALATP